MESGGISACCGQPAITKPTVPRTEINTPIGDAGRREEPRDICFSAALRRTHHPHRLVVAGRDHEELAAALRAWLDDGQSLALDHDWPALAEPGSRYVPLPRYPWQNKHYWLERPVSIPLPTLLAKVLGVAVAEDSGRDVLPEWTSLAHIRVVNAVEETYGVVLTTREIEQTSTVAALRALLLGRGVAL